MGKTGTIRTHFFDSTNASFVNAVGDLHDIPLGERHTRLRARLPVVKEALEDRRIRYATDLPESAA
jgi:hypothetical protein